MWQSQIFWSHYLSIKNGREYWLTERGRGGVGLYSRKSVVRIIVMSFLDYIDIQQFFFTLIIKKKQPLYAYQISPLHTFLTLRFSLSSIRRLIGEFGTCREVKTCANRSPRTEVPRIYVEFLKFFTPTNLCNREKSFRSWYTISKITKIHFLNPNL